MTRTSASRVGPRPEVLQNVNHDELSNLGLTAAEEADLVTFMKTLTDNDPVTGNDRNVNPGASSSFSNAPVPPFPLNGRAAAVGWQNDVAEYMAA